MCLFAQMGVAHNLEFSLLELKYYIGLFRQFIGVGHDHHTFAGFMGALFEDGCNFCGGMKEKQDIATSADRQPVSLYLSC